MSKLKELIKELCPNGVPYLELKDVLVIKNGKDYKKLSKGKYPVYGSGGIMTYVSDYLYDKPSVLIPRKGSIDKLYYTEEPFWNVDTIFYTDIDTTKVIPQYVYFCLQSEHLEQYNTAGGVPSLTQKVLNKVMLPVPPLEVQREIVRVLDTFTLLTAELTAELTARKKQYIFYRDKMLNFGDKAPIYQLSELCESIADGDHMPPPKSDAGIPFITISDVTEYHDIDYKNTMHVPESYYNSLAEKRRPRKGDILYTVVGSYGIPVCIEDNKKFVFQRHIAILRPNNAIVKSRYLFHAMQSTDFKIQADKAAKGAAQKTIALSSLAKMYMPVPDMNVQERIVNVLDNFEDICTDLKIGLPAEIKARQKQYGYYRDKLLSFKELQK